MLLLSSGRPAHWLWAASFALVALLGSPAWAQTTSPRPTKMGSWPPIPMAVCFVDGQRVDSAAFAALKPDDIADLKVVKGAAARDLDATATGRGLIAITTKQQEKTPKVVAFNQQVEQVLKAHRSPSEATIQAENAVQPADVRYYLNGQLSSRATLDKLDSHSLFSETSRLSSIKYSRS
ncbi:MAG: hypothetical protein EOO61_23490, partial [Hymenobacter sp.]